MKKAGNILALSILFLMFTTGAVYWNEAEKEIRILCSMIPAGTGYEQAIVTLETGNLLQYRETASGEEKVLSFNSFYNLYNSKCTLLIEDQVVVSGSYEGGIALHKVAAWLSAIFLSGLALLYIFLALGLPLGELAWGGKFVRLPTRLRVGSLLSAAFCVAAIPAIFDKAGIIEVIDWPEAEEIFILGLALLFFLSSVANSISKSKKERRLMTPFAFLLSFLCILVALGA